MYGLMPLSFSTSPVLQLWFAGPDLAAEYDASRLSPEDREREADRLRGRTAGEWRVSRALKSRLATPYRAASLSHSHGHALWAATSQHDAIGVDLERIRAIDVLAVAALIATDAELHWLKTLNGSERSQAFYRLWTLKEALIKAGGGAFPADMTEVGLAAPGSLADLSDCRAGLVLAGRQWHVRGLGARAWHGVSAILDPHWAMAAVWPAARLRQGPACSLFAREALVSGERPLALSQRQWIGPACQAAG